MHPKRLKKDSTNRCFYFKSLNIQLSKDTADVQTASKPHLHPEYLPVTTVPKVWATLLPSYHYKCSSHPQRFGRHNSNINHNKIRPVSQERQGFRSLYFVNGLRGGLLDATSISISSLLI